MLKAIRVATALATLALTASNMNEPRPGKVLLIVLVLTVWAATESKPPQGPRPA